MQKIFSVFSKYKLFIFDLDGTIYLDDKPIGDVIILLNSLKQKGNDVLFLTNNTSVSPFRYVKKLNELGLIWVNKENIISPLDVFINWACDFKYSFYPLLTKESTEYLTENNQLKINDLKPDLVLIGFDKEINYQKLEKACNFINLGVNYYLTNIDLSCPTIFGQIPDCGSLGRLVESVIKIKPLNSFGKPDSLMISYLNAYCNSKLIELSEVVIVGDRLYTDIKLGSNMGIDTVHVLSGDRFESETNVTPKFIFNNTNEFLKKYFEYEVQ